MENATANLLPWLSFFFRGLSTQKSAVLKIDRQGVAQEGVGASTEEIWRFFVF